MKKVLEFYKKYWFIILLAFIATSLFIIRIVFKVETSPQVTSTPTATSLNTYKDIQPGVTSLTEVSRKLGDPDPQLSDLTNNMYAYRRTQGPPDEAIVDDNSTVVFIKEPALEGTINTLIETLGQPELELYGPHQESGFKVYVWSQKGIATVAHQNEGLIFENWYFESMTIEQFKKTWGEELTDEPKADEFYD